MILDSPQMIPSQSTSNQFTSQQQHQNAEINRPTMYSLFGGAASYPLKLDLHAILASTKAQPVLKATSANGTIMPPPGFSRRALPTKLDDTTEASTHSTSHSSLAISLPDRYSSMSTNTTDTEGDSPMSVGSSNSSSACSSQTNSRKSSFSSASSSTASPTFRVRMLQDQPMPLTALQAQPSPVPSNAESPQISEKQPYGIRTLGATYVAPNGRNSITKRSQNRRRENRRA